MAFQFLEGIVMVEHFLLGHGMYDPTSNPLLYLTFYHVPLSIKCLSIFQSAILWHRPFPCQGTQGKKCLPIKAFRICASIRIKWSVVARPSRNPYWYRSSHLFVSRKCIGRQFIIFFEELMHRQLVNVIGLWRRLNPCRFKIGTTIASFPAVGILPENHMALYRESSVFCVS